MGSNDNNRRAFLKKLAIITSGVSGSMVAPRLISSGKADAATNSTSSQRVLECDLLVYGGTSAGVIAACTARMHGLDVLLVCPEKHLGGLSSGGLGYTDTGNKKVIGGMAKEFYHRIYLHYEQDEAWKWQKKEAFGNKGLDAIEGDKTKSTRWIFEPHAAEKVFEDLVKENGVKVLRNEWLNRRNGVKMKDNHIVSIRTLSNKTFKAGMFIDATYEGDLMAAAGISYHVGREANSVYHEKWNGVETGVFQHGHHFKPGIDPYKTPGDPSSGLLPRILSERPGIKGEGDNKVQAYCFRTCFTNNPGNRVPFPKPDGYDPSQYELLVRVFDAGWRDLFHKFDAVPNMKTDTNNHGPFSTDNIGMNYDYPDASYERRKEIINEHETYQKGLMYFMATDPRIPQDLQKELNTWGLPKDEFTDNGNWPHQIYVREARRMISDFVMTENEILSRRPVTDPIGMGSYALDSHNAQRYVTAEGYVQNEGDIGVKVPRPYCISYRSTVPREKECRNLLVPVCLSSSHIAYGSIRMEPVFMILGESAATAAAIAIHKKISVQQVSYGELRIQLLQQKQVLDVDDIKAEG